MPTPTIHVFRKNTRQSAPLRDAVDAVFRKKWFILTGCGLFSVLLITYVLIKSDAYESQALFLVKAERPSGAANPAPVQEESSDVRIGTEIQLLLSSDLHREVITGREANKTSTAPISSTTTETSDHPATAHSSINGERMATELKAFNRNLKVVPVPKTNLIRVVYSATDRNTARDTLRALADRYLSYHLQLHGSGSAYQFFGQQSSLYEQKLRDAQDALSSFESRSKISLLTEQKDITLRKLAETRSSLDETKTARQEAEQRSLKLIHQLSEAKPRITTQQRTVPNQYSVDRMNTMLVELQNKKTDLLTKFRPDDRRVQEVDKQINDTKLALDKAQKMTATEEATDVNPLRASVEAELSKTEVNASGLKARETGLQGQVKGYETDLAKLDDATATHDRLQQDVKSASENYQLYSRKREEARIDGALDREKIANVSLAEGPSLPLLAKPRIDVGTVCAFILGNLIVIGIAVVLGLRRTVMYAPWDLEAFTDIPVLATIPFRRGTSLRALPGDMELAIPAAGSDRGAKLD